MNKIFEKSKWIWANNSLDVDDYVEFLDTFILENSNVVIRISSDTVYALYINDELIKFMICSDFPNDKFYDEIKLNLSKKENRLKINVWHYGKDFHTAIKMNHGLIYEVIEGENVICYSNENTLSRIMNEFKNGYCKQLTRQQGFSFYYDNTVIKSSFNKSQVQNINCNYTKREINDFRLLSRLMIKVIKKTDSILIDLGKETSGIPDLEFISPVEQEVLVSYGEHLRNNGNVLRTFSSNDFSFEIKAKKGKNVIFNPLKRIAGRYLQVYTKERIEILYIGIRPLSYIKTSIKYYYEDELINKINYICLNTLDSCMHEHYEDCPWREQSLYVLDMRNQMLCGYELFKGYEYQRHNILLAAKGLDESGFISLCIPSKIKLPIPSFSLHYIIAVKEYIENTNDKSILPIVTPTIKTIMKTMLSQIDDTGLIHYFPKPYWNFYEWTEGSHNNEDIPSHIPPKDQYDLIINALLVYVIPFYNQMFNENIEVKNKLEAIHKYFYDEKRKVYCLTNKKDKYSQLGNALAYSIGLGNKELLNKIIEDPNMITISLSMKSFLYEPLLKEGEKYQQYIIDDIKNVYGAMLNDNATSCYEAAINTSGLGIDISLCHGWSALPAYYFSKLLNNNINNK